MPLTDAIEMPKMPGVDGPHNMVTNRAMLRRLNGLNLHCPHGGLISGLRRGDSINPRGLAGAAVFLGADTVGTTVLADSAITINFVGGRSAGFLTNQGAFVFWFMTFHKTPEPGDAPEPDETVIAWDVMPHHCIIPNYRMWYRYSEDDMAWLDPAALDMIISRLEAERA